MLNVRVYVSQVIRTGLTTEVEVSLPVVVGETGNNSLHADFNGELVFLPIVHGHKLNIDVGPLMEGQTFKGSFYHGVCRLWS